MTRLGKWDNEIPATRDELLATPELDGWIGELYEYLPHRLRIEDLKNGGELVKRFLTGQEYYHAWFAYTNERLLDLWNADRCPPEFLPFLAIHRGIPAKIVKLFVSPEPGESTLEEYERLRAFVKVAPHLIPLRGSDRGMRGFVRAATGQSPAIFNPGPSRATCDFSVLDDDFSLFPDGAASVVYVPYVEGETDVGLVKALIDWNTPAGCTTSAVFIYFHEVGADSTLPGWQSITGSMTVVDQGGHDFEFTEV